MKTKRTTMAITEEVFGVSSKLVMSYLERDHVDQKFLEALKSDHHVVVYGSSKQGKTSLRQKHLPESDCIIVRCGPRMSTVTLYQSVLRQSGARIQTFETRGNTTSTTAHASGGFKVNIPFAGGVDTTAGADRSSENQLSLTTEFISYDFGDAQSIAELLVALGTKKWIVLENYHYLPEETQRDIAFDLKTFHEVGVRFLILGIWREANLLVTHNGDLQGRLAEVPVEPWERHDFEGVAEKGSKFLNIRISPQVLDVFAENAYGNIGLFQEFLKVFCLRCGVTETRTLVETLEARDAVDATLNENLSARRNALVKNFQGIAAKSRVRRSESEQPLLLPYYLVMVVLGQAVDRLQEGIEKSHLLNLLRAVHHRTDKETIRVGDVTNLLIKLPLYQADMTPPVLYYDGNSRRVRIADSTVFFVLANANREEIADEIPMPEFEGGV